MIQNGILSLFPINPKLWLNVSRRIKNRRPIFIVGTGRCGTTLLASMIGTHSHITITPETAILFHIDQMLKSCSDAESLIHRFTQNSRWMDFQISPEKFLQRLKGYSILTVPIVMDEFYDCFTEVSNKLRWGDNTPTYSEILPQITKIWPNAYVIHIFRDGRGVATSWRKVFWGPKNIEESAFLWRKRINKCREDSKLCKNYLEIKYESLILYPEEKLREICEFIEEPFEKKMLAYYKLDGRNRYLSMIKNQRWKMRKEYHKNLNKPLDMEIAERWRSELNRQQISKFQIIAGDLLAELGYPII